MNYISPNIKKKQPPSKSSFWGQIAVFCLPLFVFFLSYFIFSTTTNSLGPFPKNKTFFITMAFLALFIISFIGWFRSKSHEKKHINIYLCVLLIVYLLIQLKDITVSPLWDAALYYNSLIKGIFGFDGTFPSFVNSFKAYSHPTQALFLLYAPLQYLFPGSVVSLNLTTAVLSALMLVAYYRVMQKLFLEKDIAAFGATALFAFTPQISAFTTGINPDFGVLLGFVFFLYSYFYNYKFLAFASAFLLLFSKESGTIIYAGIGLAIFIGLLKTAYEKKNIQSFFKLLLNELYLLIPVCAIFVYFVSGGFTRITGSAIAANGGILSNIQINVAHISTILRQDFLLNFMWILSCIIIVGFVFYIKSKKRKSSSHWLVFGISVAVYFVFTLLYIEIPLVRYNMPVIAFMPPLAIWAITQIPLKQKIKQIGTRCILILLFISIFASIDPLSWLSFSTATQVGNGKLINVTNQSVYEHPCEVNLYNREYLNYSRLLDDILKEYGADEAIPYVSIDVPSFSLQFFGNANSNIFLKYSPEKQKRVFFAESSVAIPGKEYFSYEEEKLPEHFRLILLPHQQENSILNIALEDNEIVQEQQFSKQKFSLKIIEMKRK